MEHTRSKRTAENREKPRKRNDQEKKTKSETTTFSSGSLTDPSLESMLVIGKGCGYSKSKSFESGYRLHECYSEAALGLVPEDSQCFRDVVQYEGLQPVASNSSFLSAKSDLNDALQKQVCDLEDKLLKQNIVINSLKNQLGHKSLPPCNSVATETDLSVHAAKEEKFKLKELEKKISSRERKIKELNLKLEETSKTNIAQIEENNNLSHKISLLNHQLQSMFEFLGKQKWNSIDPVEFAKYKNKTTELEALLAVTENEKGLLSNKIRVLSSDLENKEKECNEKVRELIEYKNRSTLEMCKLINQIDSLHKEAKNQSQFLEMKIREAQNAMDEEIVNVTQKLEEQYQKDMKSAVDKFHSDFERLADLPKTAIERLLQFCDPEKVDIISYQKEWDQHQAVLEGKIASMQESHNKEIIHLKDNYETKIMFLKTQVEAMTSQLKERKNIIDIFENELMTYKSNSSMNLLKASTLGDDISALKELYTAEIFSQKQVHKLQLDIFEEKVKTLTEEILFHAKNEEIHLQELENAKKMASIFREKYELLVFEWEEKVEKDFKNIPTEAELSPELENMIADFKSLMESLKKSENVHEERIKILEMKSNDERVSFLRDIEEFKTKLHDLMMFQKTQAKLDETIHNLIKAVGVNYTKTVEALVMSHMAEVSLKQVEMCASQKRHIEEIDGLKNEHEKEVAELRSKVDHMEDAKIMAESELASLRKATGADELEELKQKTAVMSMNYIKAEGMMAIKEETERALNQRIKELEDIIKSKEENCKKELEDLTAKYLKAEILSSTKDDLARELEEKLMHSETLLEKSCMEIDKLAEAISLFKESEKLESFHREEGGDFQQVSTSIGFGDILEEGKIIGERLKKKLVETFEKIELDGELQRAKETAGEEKRNQIFSENDRLKKEIEKLLEEGRKKEEILKEMKMQNEELQRMSELKKKLEILENEKDEIIQREKLAEKEKEEILERNEFLEESVQDLNFRIDMLMSELANNSDPDCGEVFSISLQEVRFLYEEEHEVRTSTSTAACQVQIPESSLQCDLLETNEMLQKENETLRLELKERLKKTKAELFQDKIISKFRNIQKELSVVKQERDELLKERNSLCEALEELREENLVMQAKYETRLKVLEERNMYLDNPGMMGMNEKIAKLTDYIKTLSKKLDVMKTNNQLLLSESREHLKHNQNLVSELEEAWNQRYEIEDELAKVRRENALLNLHRKQLEETNKRISGLVAEDKPSVVSWVKIHETVENIVDEVLALKTSFSDSESVLGGSAVVEPPRTNSELKLMTETLHTQLKDKTMLCDELIIQKETLEKELKNLENLILNNNWKSKCRRTLENSCSAGENLEPQTSQPAHSSLEKPRGTDTELPGNSENLPETAKSSERLIKLNKLKKHLEDQAELEKAQFRENLELEIQELKKEIQKPQESRIETNVPSGNDEECLKSIEKKYEEKVDELSKEFEREVEKLRETFATEKGGDNCGEEIDKLKKYFLKKWTDLENEYVKTIQKQSRQSYDSVSELNRILEQFHSILSEEVIESEKKSKVENFLKTVINERDEEVKSLREKYKEAVTMLETKHDSEVEKLQKVVLELKENIMTALKKESERREGDENQEEEELIDRIRAEYEAKLEEEKKKMCDLLEDAKQKHEKEMGALEEFWTEKLSECETKCAIMKATGGRKTKNQGESEEGLTPRTENVDQTLPEESAEEDKQIVKYGEIQELDSIGELRLEEHPQENLCVSCLSNQPFFKRMEVKTDDDKLDVIQQRDTLEEMISSMRSIITKLLTFIAQQKPELNNTSLDVDDTMYRSIHVDFDRTASDTSIISNGALLAKDLSTIFQEIKENSLLNSSDQVRFELDRCLKQLRNDATYLLALSWPENPGPNLSELIKKVEREKNELEAKVLKVEEVQTEMKKEINTTKERLSQWERNLEVVSEGYGEEIVEPKQRITLADMKEKLKAFLAENSGGIQDINLLEEICKEGDRLQEEWLKEKCDLQQQIDVADKQLHSLKKFLEEQAVEREQEREAFDREIMQLQENLKAKERDSSLQNRTNREIGRLTVMPLAEISVEALVGQLKELTARLTETEKNKGVIEGEFQNAVKKIWSLREVIQELESQLAEVSERENNLKKKVEKLDGLLEQQSKAQRSLKEELDASRSQNELKYSEHIKSLEDELIRLRHVADQVNPDSLMQLKANLRQIESVLIKKTKDLEQVHVSSANVSCSSPSEDVSIRDHLDATRCSTPDEMCSNDQSLSLLLPMEEIDRVHEKLARHTRAEEVAMKYIQDLKMQLRTHRKAFEEVQTERDVLLEKVDVYLKENSSLKVRLEEQRCNAGLLQKQLNANLESQISRLEVDVEKLNGMCNEKDKQLKDMKVILENTKKSLKLRETEALNKSKEENALITTLKTDLANALTENEQLEEKLEKTREKLRETLKMPALIDSMIEEKNAEIDRLEKEVERLSSEKTTSGVTSRSYSSEEKPKRKIRFSEPDSFSENISSISVQCPSDLRNCSDSFADFRNSSFKTRRPVGSSTKLESISSIAPLQLSPRGADSLFNWKTSSPFVQNEKANISPTKSPPPSKVNIEEMEEMSKLHKEIEARQSEISELQLEVDILKRQLVEVNQEVVTAKSQLKEAQNDLAAKDEEIGKVKKSEESLLITIDSLKKSHGEEVEELQNKLRFEHRKVETVYEEIKALEVKKIEIEEAFLSLKEDYNEKIEGEKKTAEALLHRIRMLETRNGETEMKMAALGKQLEDTIAESENTIQTLSKEISDLKSENEKVQMSSRKVSVETQAEGDVCVCQSSLALEMPKTEGSVAPFKENLDELKAEFDKMAAVIGEKDFNKKEAFLYAMTVRRLLSVVLKKVEELSKEVESHMKKVMECSVDDLAVKVQKELVLSAKLDNQLLSSIEANGFVSKEATPQPDSLDAAENYRELLGGGDGKFVIPKPLGNVALSKVAGLFKDVTSKMVELVRERENLGEKVSEQQKIIRLLEESLKKEKERIVEEKDRCTEDAKIMELLRVNLEKRLHDVKTKEKELKREKQQRMALEKEIENYKKQGVKSWESKRVGELNAQLESHREKLLLMNQALEEEKKKNQELRLALEEEKIERISEKNAQRFLDSDLALIREQKENLKMELLNARKLLHSRNVEIGLLKRKINLQEIDIKALSFSSNIQNPSESSSLTSNGGNLADLGIPTESPTSLLFKMRKLNSCVQRHVKDSSDMGEALLYLSQEAEQMKDIIRKLEENSETKLADETLVPDFEVERKLWALDKGKLVMDLEAVKRENEMLKSDLIGSSKLNEALKQENSKLKKENRSPKTEGVTTSLVENGFLQERVSHLTRKYMRTESYRKALAWQKHYLLITLREYQRSEEEAWRKMGKRRKETRKRGQKCGRFRVVALAVISIFRMKFIVKRWQRNTLNHVFSLFETQTNKLKLAPLASVLNIYNEPVNPLSYQTQNIFHQSSSQVLRTPPSRDPGPRSFSLDSKTLPDRLEPFDFCQENGIDILKGLP